MTIELGGLTFDRVVYDHEADVLYLTVSGEPVAAYDAIATPEGHVIRYSESGDIVGITFVNAKWLAEREGDVALFRVAAEQLAPALA